jgi:hypothetical protein
MRSIKVIRCNVSAASSAHRLGWCCLAAAIAVTPVLAQQSGSAGKDPASVTVKSGERSVAVYRYVENPAKPYVAVLCSPSGVNVLRDSPADHKHHHGLMFAVAADGVDFWSENDKCGRQLNRSRDMTETPGQDGALVVGPQQIDWVGPGNGKLVLHETRRISVHPGTTQSAPTLLTWDTELQTPAGDPVTLTGSTYFGLGMRFVVSMDKGGQFVNADGKTGVSGTNNARSAWCAYSASADGKPVTVAMFDSPGNPRHPATWFTMDQGFAYLSATLDLSRQPLTIEPGKPLKLRYHVAVWDGKADAVKIAAVYSEL